MGVTLNTNPYDPSAACTTKWYVSSPWEFMRLTMLMRSPHLRLRFPSSERDTSHSIYFCSLPQECHGCDEYSQHVSCYCWGIPFTNPCWVCAYRACQNRVLNYGQCPWYARIGGVDTTDDQNVIAQALKRRGDNHWIFVAGNLVSYHQGGINDVIKRGSVGMGDCLARDQKWEYYDAASLRKAMLRWRWIMSVAWCDNCRCQLGG